SLEFYTRYFGFDRTTTRTFPDGTVIVRDGDGFDLALHVAPEMPAPAGFLHFGFAMPDADAVRHLRGRMAADGVRIVEQDEEPAHVSFKCLDPDGWRVEIYWDTDIATSAEQAG
ncbi:MAG TPA: VOC family protein, partial [Jatrophihabitans sp.]|nr:VOC family protein [Jatrophihabitans sp.]